MPHHQKMTIDNTTLIHMLMLLQCPNIIQNRVFYTEIWTMEPMDPQTLYMARTVMESYKEAYQLEEHDA